ncbi:MAG: putative toxin-antitoxin system toxin component, PIN family [Gallionella sp.]|nr:putative toxin-antitoxin system toxin component, PIN family [Gallionella sp.]
MRAVIDTNILVSALLTPGGVSAQLIAAIRSRTLMPVVSAMILAEYAEVLNRPKFSFANKLTASLLEDLKGLALFLKPLPIPLQDLPDPDDAPFIAAALTAACPVITGNSKHFPQGIGIETLSPSEALARLQAK